MEHDKYIVALGLVSTCKPDMVIDIDDPVGMMTQVCDEFDQLRARNAELEAEVARLNAYAVEVYKEQRKAYLALEVEVARLKSLPRPNKYLCINSD